ncbi:MAG TPA: FAD-dependent oxidoreductase [Terriglobales bacterium]|nr:FAD-dependent oxidoreductase [Terriglobales bacterium]
MRTKPHIAVIGAGAFGGWTALYLLRAGARVTLLDAWGPGNSRASSGGETRVIRGTYGPNSPYTAMAERALHLWKQHEKEFKRQFLHRTGVLWMAASGEDTFERGSVEMLRQAGTKYQELSVRTIKKRWPQINLEDVNWGIYEPEGAYLTARLICQAVAERFCAEGGEYRSIAASPAELESGDWKQLLLADESRLAADQYIFACGPWLGKLFPVTVGNNLRPTKQDIFFFGTPANAGLDDQHLPVWADHRDRFRYGIPGNQGRGFKIADDTRGPTFDPTDGERVVSPEGLRAIREYLAFRFPAMKGAPLLETRVCQYEQTPDNHLIVDRHPRKENVWLLGGGSGHGFKHGPAIGEIMVELILRGKESQSIFNLARFGKPAAPPRATTPRKNPRLASW